MSGTMDSKEKKTLTLSKKIELKKVERDQVRQSFSHGRSKTVEVEVKRKRTIPPNQTLKQDPPLSEMAAAKHLTEGELENRFKALQKALKADIEEETTAPAEEQLKTPSPTEIPPTTIVEEEIVSEPSVKTETLLSTSAKEDEETKTLKEEVVTSKARPLSKTRLTAESILKDLGAPVRFDAYKRTRPSAEKTKPLPVASKPELEPVISPTENPVVEEEGKNVRKKTTTRIEPKKAVPSKKVPDSSAAPRKLTRQVLTKVLDDDLESRARSIASLKRARQKQKHQKNLNIEESAKIVREVAIPDAILVSELANRMAVRGADVVRTLMKMGMMVTLNQTIDADTAELVCSEFGHQAKRVSDEIEFSIADTEDNPADLQPRAPVVTIMGHVDHGKTSLLDALRETDVAAGEAGGITQHIGAYQVTLQSGERITFVDTPGHAAFTEMRARGANITDIVILVVAADDGVMEQTVEAINHAKAAKAPIIVAINKIDKPDSNPERVRTELLQHGLVLEAYGGDIIAVEVSARQKLNLDKLEEAILLQAEVLELKANPNRLAQGVVVEAKMDKGRGPIATILVQKGTLNIGDVFVAGTEWGKVRALISDHGHKVNAALPSIPIEVLGFNGVPLAGDEFRVVDNEARAREIAEYRERRQREKKNLGRASIEQMMSKIAAGEAKELPIVVKADVQGSLEAIVASLSKLATDEVVVRVLHGGVGSINEGDVALARASNGLIIGFNVRANLQAREIARHDNVDIRYYSIIYDVLDDIKSIMSGLLAPTLRERYLGTAEIRTIFNVTKVGKIAGSFVTEGAVRRGAKVRLLRDNIVIHEGELKTLRRFKEEVKEVKASYECGIAFENYQDIREGDVVECFEIESITRQL